MFHPSWVSRALAFLSEIIPLMARALSEDTSAFGDSSKWAGRGGAGFCILNWWTGEWVLEPTLVGNPDPEKRDKYLALCREKAERLASRLTHVSSWQSRDPENGRWGGAIRYGDYIFSLSGLPELGDEALMLSVVRGHLTLPTYLSDKTLNSIAEESGNPYWQFMLYLTK